MWVKAPEESYIQTAYLKLDQIIPKLHFQVEDHMKRQS